MQTSIVTNVTDTIQLVQEPSSHDHAPNTRQALRDSTVNSIRQEIKNDRTKGLNSAYGSVILQKHHLSDATRCLLPEYDSVRT